MNRGILGFPRGGPVQFYATLSADQSGISALTHTKLLMNDVASGKFGCFNQGGFYDAANSRFCPPKGRYFLFVSVFWSAGIEANKRLWAQIYKNGAAVLQVLQHTSSTDTIVSQGGRIIETSGNDYFEAYVFMNPTGSSTVGRGSIGHLSAFQGFQL